MEVNKKFYSYPIKQISINGKIWEYIVTGKRKDTLVVFPGGAQSAQSLFYYIREFEELYKVITITLYDADSIEEFCNATEKIIAKEKVGDISFYGYSIGAMLVQSFLRRTKMRNLIKKVIISHGCTPGSKIYKYNLVIPLQVLYIFILLLPNDLITFLTKKMAIRAQGVSNESSYNDQFDDQTRALQRKTGEEFYEKYLTKRLWKTWYRIHTQYCYEEKFLVNDLKGWNGKVLVMQTDNDPWMRDENGLRKLYPKAKFVTFHGTAHLTFYFQFNKVIGKMKEFLTK